MIACDTCVLSLALRRNANKLDAMEKRIVRAVGQLIAAGEMLLLEPVRQELLSGISRIADYEKLREHLREMDALPVTTDDFERAAWCYNQCRRAGLAAGSGDALICSLALQADAAIFTTDKDFFRYPPVIPIRVPTIDQIEGLLEELQK